MGVHGLNYCSTGSTRLKPDPRQQVYTDFDLIGRLQHTSSSSSVSLQKYNYHHASGVCRSQLAADTLPPSCYTPAARTTSLRVADAVIAPSILSSSFINPQKGY